MVRYFMDHVFNYPTLAGRHKVAALAGPNKRGADRAARIAPALGPADTPFLLGHAS